MESKPSHLIFIGTYNKTGSRGIYSARLDAASGALSAPELAVETPNPSFLAFAPGKKFLYTVHPSPAMAVGFAVDGVRGGLTPLAAANRTEAVPPSHVAVDHTGRVLLAAHFHGGKIASLPVRADGNLGEPLAIAHHGHSVHPVRQASPHPHSSRFSPDNRFALVCDLGLDRIFTYRLDPEGGGIQPAAPPFTNSAPGSGPRHSTFGAGGRQFYVINEINNTISVHDYDAARGALAPRQTLSTLPAGFTGTSSTAEICLHPNGKFIYGSNRGHDSIASFAVDPATGGLTPVAIVPCGGKAPRNFALSPDGKWLVCAHQDSDTLCSFGVDAATGRLTPTGNVISVGMPVCVLFHD